MLDSAPSSVPPLPSGDLHTPLGSLKHSLTTKDGWIGNYDYKALCMPRLPCLPTSFRASSSRSIFFGLEDRVPTLVAILMGFQHALAMVGGVIAVPRILSGLGPQHLQLGPDLQAYLISTALIVSGLMSIIQIVRFRIGYGYYIGTGLISMSGISFTFLPVAQATFAALRSDGLCGDPGQEGPCPDAYGKWLGTVMVGALLEIVLSFIPPRALRKTFPPLVTGTTVFLIGASLIPVGLSQWAGGAGPCRDVKDIEQLNGIVPGFLENFRDCPNIFGPGDRHYPWGAPEWIGLGFFVFTIIIIVETFGSPFLRNTQVMIGLIAGVILSASLGYMDKSLIDAAPWFTFPLVRRFKLGFYAPALIPVLIAHAVSTVETLGDIAASSEASKVPTDGEDFESRVQGGLLADGVNSLIAGLLTSSPTTTFSQNNGVIVMTRCANRVAGLWAAAWLVLMGVFGKIGGVFVAIPDAVLGGMTVFLFANVTVSGIRMLSKLRWDRRDSFILAISLSLGLGVVIRPTTFIYFLPSTEHEFSGALRQGAVIVLSTGYSVGALVAAILNLLVPDEEEAISAEDYRTGLKLKGVDLDETIDGNSSRHDDSARLDTIA